MNIEDIRNYSLEKNYATESFPFGPDTLVFKVGGKVFLLCDLEKADSFNAKCDPEWAVSLREEHPEIIPGYHMNKTHWNTIKTDGFLSEKMIKDLIDHSYDLVFKSLSKTIKMELIVEY